jgi:hypothetical protein
MPRREPPPSLDRRILEELIYERVRLTVDLCELMAFEVDLSASIERALVSVARSPSQRSDLTLEYLQRAWERVTEQVVGNLAENELGPPP